VDLNSVVHNIDLSNPASPREVGTSQVPSGDPIKLAATSNYLYAAVSGKGLTILDISSPAEMYQVGAVSTNLPAIYGAGASGGYVGVADIFYGLYIIDVSSPTQPFVVGSYNDPLGPGAKGVVLAGPIAYDLGFGGVLLLSLTNASAPQPLFSANVAWCNGIAVNANRICVAADGSGLVVLQPMPLPPSFDGPPQIEADGCHVSFVAEAGQSIVLQRSQDLVTWQDWLTVTGDGASQEVIDPDVPSRPVQFYRAVVQ
jgi:hypothetical protein